MVADLDELWQIGAGAILERVRQFAKLSLSSLCVRIIPAFDNSNNKEVSLKSQVIKNTQKPHAIFF